MTNEQIEAKFAEFGLAELGNPSIELKTRALVRYGELIAELAHTIKKINNGWSNRQIWSCGGVPCTTLKEAKALVPEKALEMLAIFELVFKSNQ